MTDPRIGSHFHRKSILTKSGLAVLPWASVGIPALSDVFLIASIDISSLEQGVMMRVLYLKRPRQSFQLNRSRICEINQMVGVMMLKSELDWLV